MQKEGLEQLVKAILEYDALSARQWLMDRNREGMDWSQIPRPSLDDAVHLAVAAGVVELFCERAGQKPPQWTTSVGAVSKDMYLVRSALSMPRLRRMCREEGPEPLRRRHLLAPPEFLKIA